MNLRIIHPMFDNVTHERLVNWSRCVLSGSWSGGTCNSIEGRYDRSKDDDIVRNLDDESMRRRPTIDPDPHDGALVERVLCAPSFPKDPRELLRLHYVWRIRPERTCRKLGIRYREYDDRVVRAALIVRNRLSLVDA